MFAYVRAKWDSKNSEKVALPLFYVINDYSNNRHIW